MKKSLFTIILYSLSSLAFAGYTWNGGTEITTEGWGTESNWTLSGDSSWEAGKNGPGTTNSNMWDDIYISNATGTIGSSSDTENRLEGWKLKLHLEQSNLTFYRTFKFQGGCTIDIDSLSSLTINEYWGGVDGDYIYLNNAGSFTLSYSCHQQEGNGFVMNLFDTGSVSFLDQNHASPNAAKVASIAAQLIGISSGIQTRQLITLDTRADHTVTFDSTATTYSFTTASGEEMMAVNSLEELQTASVPSYFVTKDNTGISVSYVVPEPATATLSLLALGALAMRRRRA